MSRLLPNMHPILKSVVIDLLHAKQIFTVNDFLKTENKLIEKTTNLTFKEILDVKKYLLKQYSAQPKNAFEYYEYIIVNFAIIQTGIKKIDVLLEGGLFTGNIYEICGLPGVGKTLFCLTLVKNIVSNVKEIIYYLDTKNDFCARKLKQILSNVEKGGLVEALNKILVKRIHTRFDLINSLYEIKEMLENGLKLRVIVIDSLPVLYFQSSDHTDNNAFLNHIINILRYLTNEYNTVVVVTNLITLWNEGDFRNQDILKESICCGNYWYNVPNVRLKFEKHPENKCKVTLLRALRVMPEVCDCEVQIDVGIT